MDNFGHICIFFMFSYLLSQNQTDFPLSRTTIRKKDYLPVEETVGKDPGNSLA